MSCDKICLSKKAQILFSGNMSAKRMPQLVILTFDDSVNDLNKGLYQVSSLNSMSWWSRVTAQEDGFLLATGPKMWLKVLLHEARVCVTAEMITRWGKWVGIYRRGKWLAHFNQQNASHTHWLIFLKASHPKQKPCLFFKGIQEGKYSYSLTFETAASNASCFNFCPH